MIDWRLPQEASGDAPGGDARSVAEPAASYRGFRVPTARLPGRDYGMGWSLVTFVTRDRARCLGRLARGRFVPDAAGRVVAEECRRTGAVRPGVRLDAVAVLPDHVHAIIGMVDGRTVDGPSLSGGPPLSDVASLGGWLGLPDHLHRGDRGCWARSLAGGNPNAPAAFGARSTPRLAGSPGFTMS